MGLNGVRSGDELIKIDKTKEDIFFFCYDILTYFRERCNIRSEICPSLARYDNDRQRDRQTDGRTDRRTDMQRTAALRQAVIYAAHALGVPMCRRSHSH